MKRYNRKVTPVTAMQLAGPLTYTKWGGQQQAKRGDYLVNNGDESYTVDKDSFHQTYEQPDPNVNEYFKTSSVWAYQATTGGWQETKEGKSAYGEGDYIVANNSDGSDAYVLTPEKFHELYEVA